MQQQPSENSPPSTQSSPKILKKLFWTCTSLCGLALLLAALHYQWDTFGLQPLEFTTYASLRDTQVSSQEYQSIFDLHNECFDEDKRKNLQRYIKEAKFPHSSEAMQELIKQKVNAYMQTSRLEKAKYLRDSTNMTVARKNQRIVGLYNCNEDYSLTDGSIMIFNVCLSPGLRGKGLGRKLMEHAIERCPQTGKDLTLTVYKDNTKAIKLYEKLNFRIIEATREPQDDFTFFNKHLMKYFPGKTEVK